MRLRQMVGLGVMLLVLGVAPSAEARSSHAPAAPSHGSGGGSNSTSHPGPTPSPAPRPASPRPSSPPTPRPSSAPAPRPSSGGRGLGLTLLPSPKPKPQPAPPAPSWSFAPAPSGPTPTPIAPILTSGKLGIGLYGGIPFDSLVQMKPAVFLVEDPSPDAAQQLRHVFPNALIVGRHFVPDGDSSLANCSDASENHQAKGASFADLIASQALPLKGVVDAWASDNETASSSDQADLPCHAAFQLGFVERLQQTYGIDAVAGDDATGAVEPADYATYFGRAISEAAYFGLHAYGKPGATTLQTPDAQYYALRYRMVHDALVQAGVRLPRGGFLLTETGLYDGWRGAVGDQAMASDFLWLDQQLSQDDYVRGQMIFGLGLVGRFTNFDLQGTSVPALLGAR